MVYGCTVIVFHLFLTKIYDFLFSSLGDETIPEEGLLIRGKNDPRGANYLLEELTFIEKGGKMKMAE